MRVLSLRAVLLAGLALILATGPALAAQTAAPTFTLDLFNGQTLRLADLRGTAVILLFWAQW